MSSRPVAIIGALLALTLLPPCVRWYLRWVSDGVAVALWLVVLALMIRSFFLWRGRKPLKFEPAAVQLALFTLLPLYAIAGVDRGLLNDVDRGLLFPPNRTVEYRSAEFSFDAHINSLGFRDHEYTREPSKYRICAIGDSFTFGLGVDIDSTWVKRADRMLPNTEVLNLGQPGSSPIDYAKTAEEATRTLGCQMIVVGLLQGNDFYQTLDKGRRRFYSEPFTLALTRLVYPNLTRLASNWRLESVQDAYVQQLAALKQLWTEEEWTRYRALDPAVREAVEAGRLNPAVIRRDVMEHGMFMVLEDTAAHRDAYLRLVGYLRRIGSAAPTVVFSLPSGPYVSEAYRAVHGIDIPEGYTSVIPDLYRRAAAEAGVEYIEANGRFVDDLFYPMDGHLNDRGHAVAAAVIVSALSRRLN